jgi:hypothetical protein
VESQQPFPGTQYYYRPPFPRRRLWRADLGPMRETGLAVETALAAGREG